MSSAETTFVHTWEHNVEIARRADALGMEMMLSAMRWKSIAGTSDFNRASFDTYAWAAGLGQATENIMLFVTTHVPTIHPVLAAKQAATIDHISGGRVGLNLVMGWNSPEIEMFGPQLEHDERYQHGAEWIDIVTRLWAEKDVFDYEGKYFRVPGAESLPKPVQPQRPLLVNAGNSPAGKEFSARYMDFNFVAVGDAEQAAREVADVRSLARDKYERDIGVLTYVYVVCRETEKEANRVRDSILEHGDREAVFNVVSRYDPAGKAGGMADQVRNSREAQDAFILGSGSYPIIGSPEQVVEEFQKLSDLGMDGAVMVMLDYNEDTKFFGEAVMPLMRSAGLRK
jgi:alkanesulfonate monooxygenase SsuD/methylene tetrahydromethanopterin reductase-like flavin-dependent oxidoreductase (luciferase family)